MHDSPSDDSLYVDPADSQVPPWSRLTAPVLRTVLDGNVYRRREIVSLTREKSGVSASGIAETLNSGELRINNRVNWAIQHLSKAALIEVVTRGHYRITEAGTAWLKKYPEGMDYAEANKFFSPFWPSSSTQEVVESPIPAEQVSSIQSVDETMDSAERTNQRTVGAELLKVLRESDPDFFETVVVDVLLAMGYGGAHGKGAAIAKSHDGGIDGVIDEDALGLDKIYVQAKRYAEGNNVGSQAIQGFVGALHGKAAQKGVFFTTSTFTPAARNYANSIPTNLVLIDGERLVDLMMHYRVGVQARRTYVTLEIDQDYFD